MAPWLLKNWRLQGPTTSNGFLLQLPIIHLPSWEEKHIPTQPGMFFRRWFFPANPRFGGIVPGLIPLEGSLQPWDVQQMPFSFFTASKRSDARGQEPHCENRPCDVHASKRQKKQRWLSAGVVFPRVLDEMINIK